MRKSITLIFALSLSVQALALPPTITSPKAIGNAQFSLLGLPLYSATMYTENGAAYNKNEQFILELTYRRHITAANLIRATLSEMDRMGNLSDRGTLEASFGACFRDVKKGDQFAAVHKGRNTIDLYLNDQKTCTLSAPNISARFFGIWLSNDSRAPKLSKTLRGE